ncbi:hypothetical protein BJX66DRAFT_317619 [Aspergillus keveii]|uniref:Uncharacterized protein n=1 Tax=Aspergillus keveii TaxID=714993 RepID=A0ABR4FKW9_9EURO
MSCSTLTQRSALAFLAMANGLSISEKKTTEHISPQKTDPSHPSDTLPEPGSAVIDLKPLMSSFLWALLSSI